MSLRRLRKLLNTCTRNGALSIGKSFITLFSPVRPAGRAPHDLNLTCVPSDIKPENILFHPIPFVASKNPIPKQPGDEDKVDEGEFVKGVGGGGIGQIKIADFGLSK